MLKLMRKGVDRLQNISLLKWAHYYGIKVTWNMLEGLPRRDATRTTREQAGSCPRSCHLPPPTAAAPIWMERFSPYFTMMRSG